MKPKCFNKQVIIDDVSINTTLITEFVKALLKKESGLHRNLLLRKYDRRYDSEKIIKNRNSESLYMNFYNLLYFCFAFNVFSTICSWLLKY